MQQQRQGGTHEREAQRQATIGAIISVLVNVVLTVGKGGIGMLTGSQALFADAVHSAADLLGSVAVVVGLRVARKPPDEDHPYGHGKAELISSAFVACLLIAASIEVAIRSIRALWEAPTHPAWASAWAAIAAIVLKALMYQYNYRVGKRVNSKSLLAMAADHRSDVYSSIAALAGILLSLLGRQLGTHWLLYMDAVAGAFVAALVLKIGYDVVFDAVQVLMDRVMDDVDAAPYRQLVESVPGVRHIDVLYVREHGRYVVVDVKISVDADITVAQGHEIAGQVKRELRNTFPRVLDVLVHVNPFFPGEQEEVRND